MKFFDWLNQNPYWMLIISILIICLRCSTPQQTTIDLQNQAQKTEAAIEQGVTGCKSLECQDAMRRSKDYIKDSLETIKNRDSQIADLQNDNQKSKAEIKELEKEVAPWRKIKRTFYFTIIALVIGAIIYFFKDTIFTLIKTALKIA